MGPPQPSGSVELKQCQDIVFLLPCCRLEQPAQMPNFELLRPPLVRSVGNTSVLRETALIEAFNLKSAIEHAWQNSV